jgi:hypothetical protein
MLVSGCAIKVVGLPRRVGGSDHFIKENGAAFSFHPEARTVVELLRLSLTDKLFAATDYKVVGLALVFLRNGTCDPAHQDKATGWQVYRMEDPAPSLPGGLRLLFSFTPGRQMQYSRLVGGVRQVLKPPELPDDFGTAQVIGQSARAAGAGGRRVPGNDLFHARINSRSGGGAAGPRAQQQQPRVEVTVRLDVWLPALGAARKALQVPSFMRNSAYRIFAASGGATYQGVGGGARPAAELTSEADSFSKLHCGRCVKPLSESASTHHSKAVNEGATYWVCGVCDEKLRACGQDRKAVSHCPTAAEGGSGCKCCCKPKQAPTSKRKAGGKGFSSPKMRKLKARRKNEFQEGDH